MTSILDGIKARNEERRKRKEAKIRKYAEEMHNKKSSKPMSSYSIGDASKNISYTPSSNISSYSSSVVRNPYSYTGVGSNIGVSKNMEYGVISNTPKNTGYGVVNPVKNYGYISPSKLPTYGSSNVSKPPAYGVSSSSKVSGYGLVNPIKGNSPSHNPYLPKSSTITSKPTYTPYYFYLKLGKKREG